MVRGPGFDTRSGHILLFLLPLIQEGQLSVTGESMHTYQVLRKSKSETARAPLIFAYNLVIEHVEKSGAQVLRVRFFPLF